MEVVPCPCCLGDCVAFSRRKRIRRTPDGRTHWLWIRRLRCEQCHTIHHELPDCCVPYKRFDTESLELALTDGPTAAVAADESTLARWRTWFAAWSIMAAARLAALAARDRATREEHPSRSLSPILQALGRWVGDAPGWLARAVRPLVNAHLWMTTRSAWVAELAPPTIEREL